MGVKMLRRGDGRASGGCDLLDTSSFLTTSSGERFAMKTSASGFAVSNAGTRSQSNGLAIE